MTSRAWASAAALTVAAGACGGRDLVGRADTGVTVNRATAVEPVVDDVAVVYLTIRNGGEEEDTLVAVKTGGAGRAEIHDQTHHGEMVRMSRQEFVAVPPGDEVILAPGGLHVMLMELTEPIAAGDTIAVDFLFARGGTRTVLVPVVTYGDLP